METYKNDTLKQHDTSTIPSGQDTSGNKNNILKASIAFILLLSVIAALIITLPMIPGFSSSMSSTFLWYQNLSIPLQATIGTAAIVTTGVAIGVPSFYIGRTFKKNLAKPDHNKERSYVEEIHYDKPYDKPLTKSITYNSEPLKWLSLDKDNNPTINNSKNSRVGIVALSTMPKQSDIQKISDYLKQRNITSFFPYKHNNQLAFTTNSQNHLDYAKLPYSNTPQDTANIVISAIKQGMNLWNMQGGTGLGRAVHYINKHFKEHPEDLPRSPIKIFGFSDTSNAIAINENLVQFVSSHNGSEIKREGDVKDELDVLVRNLSNTENIQSTQVIKPLNIIASQLTNVQDSGDDRKSFVLPVCSQVLTRMMHSKQFQKKIQRLSKKYKFIINLEGFIGTAKTYSIHETLNDLVNIIGRDNIKWVELGDLITAEETRAKYEDGILVNELNASDAQNKTTVNNLIKAEEKNIMEVCFKHSLPLFTETKIRHGHGFHNPMKPSGEVNSTDIKHDKKNNCLSYIVNTQLTQNLTTSNQPVIKSSDKEMLNNFIKGDNVKIISMEELNHVDPAKKQKYLVLLPEGERNNLNFIMDSLLYRGILKSNLNKQQINHIEEVMFVITDNLRFNDKHTHVCNDLEEKLSFQDGFYDFTKDFLEGTHKNQCITTPISLCNFKCDRKDINDKQKVKVVYSPRLLHHPNNDYGKFTKGTESTISRSLKHAHMSATMLDHKKSIIRNALERDENEAVFLFGAAADIAEARKDGLHHDVLKRIKFEQRLALEAAKEGKITFGACGGFQHLLTFALGLDQEVSIPNKEQGGTVDHHKKDRKMFEVAHPIIITDEHSVLGQISKEFGSWDEVKKQGVLQVNSIHKQGFKVSEFAKLQKNLQQFFEGETCPFTINLTAQSEDGIIEAIEVREKDTDILIWNLYQFHPEYTRQSIELDNNIPENEHEKVGNRMLEISREKILESRHNKPKTQTLSRFLNFIEHIKEQGLGEDKIKTKPRHLEYDTYVPPDGQITIAQ